MTDPRFGFREFHLHGLEESRKCQWHELDYILAYYAYKLDNKKNSGAFWHIEGHKQEKKFW